MQAAPKLCPSEDGDAKAQVAGSEDLLHETNTKLSSNKLLEYKVFNARSPKRCRWKTLASDRNRKNPNRVS